MHTSIPSSTGSIGSATMCSGAAAWNSSSTQSLYDRMHAERERPVGLDVHEDRVVGIHDRDVHSVEGHVLDVGRAVVVARQDVLEAEAGHALVSLLAAGGRLDTEAALGRRPVEAPAVATVGGAHHLRACGRACPLGPGRTRGAARSRDSRPRSRGRGAATDRTLWGASTVGAFEQSCRGGRDACARSRGPERCGRGAAGGDRRRSTRARRGAHPGRGIGDLRIGSARAPRPIGDRCLPDGPRARGSGCRRGRRRGREERVPGRPRRHRAVRPVRRVHALPRGSFCAVRRRGPPGRNSRAAWPTAAPAAISPTGPMSTRWWASGAWPSWPCSARSRSS